MFTLGSLIVSIALLWALVTGGMQPITAAQAQPAALLALEQIPAGNAEMLAAQSSGIWRNYTNGNYVHALAVESNYVWAGTQGGVVRWDRTSGTYAKYTTADGLADNWVNAIAIDGAGHKWFGTYSGVSEFDDSTWTTYTATHGLAHNWVYAIAIDGAGHKWFGTRGGVSEFDGSTWTTYTTADGLPDNQVWAIAIDEEEHKWFGTGRGVSEFDGSTWTTYTTADGLAHNGVLAITIDEEGHKWFGTSGGVSEYIPGVNIYLPIVVKNAQQGVLAPKKEESHDCETLASGCTATDSDYVVRDRDAGIKRATPYHSGQRSRKWRTRKV